MFSSLLSIYCTTELPEVMAARVPLQSRGNLQGTSKKSARPRGFSIDRAALLEDLRSISENFATAEFNVMESDLTSPTVRW